MNTFTYFVRLIVLLVFVQLCTSAMLHAQSREGEKSLYITDGIVNTIATDGDDIYIGGSFGEVGPVTGYMAKLSSTSAVPDLNFPIINGQVNVIVPDGLGGVYVGGLFTKVGNTPRKNLVHIFADASLDNQWIPEPNGEVLSLAKGEDGVYVGGRFDSIGGRYRKFIAKVNTISGEASKSWLPSVTCAGNNTPNINAIVLENNAVYFGGVFDSVAGVAVQNLVRVDAIKAVPDNNWLPNPTGSVTSITIDNGSVFVGGDYSSIAGYAQGNLSKLDTVSGKLDTLWRPVVNGDVRGIAINDSSVYFCGALKSVDGVTQSGVARLNRTTGELDKSWNIQTNDVVNAVLANGNSVYILGNFTTVNNKSHKRIARVYATTGGTEIVWNPNANGELFAIALQGSFVYVGGNMTSIGGRARSNVAKLNKKTGVLDEFWNPRANGQVHKLIVTANDIIVAGKFSEIGGGFRRSVAKVAKITGSLNTNFNAMIGGGEIPNVYAIAADSTHLYIGGDFVAIEGASGYSIAKLDVNTGKREQQWEPQIQSAPQIKSFVRDIKLSGSNAFVGGFFSTVKGSSYNNFVKLDKATANPDPNFKPELNNTVMCLSIYNQNLYLGGLFTKTGANTTNYATKIDLNSGKRDTLWQPNPNFNVFSIAATGNQVYLAGIFTEVGGEKQNLVTQTNNTDGAVNKNWSPDVSNGVLIRDVVIDGSDILIGGLFRAVNGAPKSNIASFPGSTLNNDSNGNDKNHLVQRLQLVQNYPNPFNPETTFEFTLPVAGKVKVQIYNTLGELVSEIAESYYAAGTHKTTWNASARHTSGVYYYSLQLIGESGEEYREVKKMLLLK